MQHAAGVYHSFQQRWGAGPKGVLAAVDGPRRVVICDFMHSAHVISCTVLSMSYCNGDK